MNTVINSKLLAASARLAGKLANNRSSLPILQTVRVQAGNSCLALHATDLDASMTIIAPAHTDTEGDCCVPAKRLIDVAGSCQDAIELDLKKGALHVLNGASYQLATLPVEEFPPFPNMEGAKQFVIMSEDLRKVIKHTEYAQSTDVTRYVLGGICLELHKGRLVAIATDGRRMSIEDAACGWAEETPVEGEGKTAIERPIQLLFPSAAVKVLYPALPKDNVPVIVFFKIAEHGNIAFMFKAGDLGVHLISKMIDGNYPNYKVVWPNDDEFKARIVFSRDELLAALKKMAKATTEKCNSVRLEFTKNNVKLNAGPPDAKAELNVAINYKGKEQAIALCPAYLVDVLAALDTDEVTVNLVDELSPLTITAGTFRAIVMPMRMS